MRAPIMQQLWPFGPGQNVLDFLASNGHVPLFTHFRGYEDYLSTPAHLAAERGCVRCLRALHKGLQADGIMG